MPKREQKKNSAFSLYVALDAAILNTTRSRNDIRAMLERLRKHPSTEGEPFQKVFALGAEKLNLLETTLDTLYAEAKAIRKQRQIT